MTNRQLSVHRGIPDSPLWDTSQSRILDAADVLIQQRGVDGVTIAELARKSQLSRPTIYRTWASSDDVVRAALLRRVAHILVEFPKRSCTRTEIVDNILEFSLLFRNDAVFGHLLADEPEIFTRYVLHRVGASQRLLLGWLGAAIAAAQDSGTVRTGDPGDMSVMLLLIAQSALMSHGTVSELISERAWQSELRAALDGHLRP